MTDFMYTQMVMCAGCSKAVWFSASSGYTCTVYEKPYGYGIRNRTRCLFNPVKVEAKKKGFVNPIKASKRRGR
jgi:hypothetical protein